MWFRMAVGCEGITVEQQAFATEVRDAEGHGYFRAPPHFAPRILMMPGFIQAEPPDGAPEDLPQPDALRDGAITELTRSNQALSMENGNLRSDLNAATARIAALVNEKRDLQTKVTVLETKIEELTEALEDKPAAVEPKKK